MSSLRSRLGWVAMIASLGLWGLLPLLPFLPISNAQRVAYAVGVLVAAEILFWVGAVMAGPDAAKRMRSWWRRKSPDGGQHGKGISRR